MSAAFDKLTLEDMRQLKRFPLNRWFAAGVYSIPGSTMGRLVRMGFLERKHAGIGLCRMWDYRKTMSLENDTNFLKAEREKLLTRLGEINAEIRQLKRKIKAFDVLLEGAQESTPAPAPEKLNENQA